MQDNGFNVQDNYKHYTVEQLQKIYKQNSLPFAVGVFNVSGNLNTSVIFRTAVCMGARKLFTFGDTRFDRRGLVGVNNYCEIENYKPENYEDIDLYLRERNYWPLFIEKTDKSHSINSLKYVRQSCLIFGNESTGIPEEFMNPLYTYHIPMHSFMRSLNVGAAAAIAINHVAERLTEK